MNNKWPQNIKDISDLIDEEDNVINSKSDDMYEGHELLQFLEQEESRLIKLDTYFTRKHDNLIATPQSQEIYKNVCNEVLKRKKSLVAELLPISSAVNQEMTQMWKLMLEMS